MAESRPPFPPFDGETATAKVRAAEDGWNSRNPERVSMAYTNNSIWRNRSDFFIGRLAIIDFLTRKWERELEYRLIKQLWAYADDQIAVRFAYEWRDLSGSWFRSYGNENWAFDPDGLMRARHASINDVLITQAQRLFHWAEMAPRPADHPGLSELGL